jgi:hypothetical protein
MGFAWKFTNTNSISQFVQFYSSGGSSQMNLTKNSDGSLALNSAFGTNTSSAGVVTPGNWSYIEIRHKVDNTQGAYEVRVDGEAILTGSFIDTQVDGSNQNIAEVRIGSSSFHSNTNIFDDIYILDNTGTTNNDSFLGEQKVVLRRPTGNGVTTDWTPSAGSNFQNVDDSPDPDDHATKNTTLTNGAIDLYTFPNISAGGLIVNGVQVVFVAARPGIGAGRLREVTRAGGTNYKGDTKFPSDAFKIFTQIRDQNPDTSAKWKLSEVNNAEFGVEAFVP